MSESRASGSRESHGDRSAYAVLVCEARGRHCAIPLRDVIETMRPLPLETVGDLPEFVRGVAIIRGAAVPVVDLGRLLGDVRAHEPTRFLTLRVAARTVALSVDRILGVRTVDAAPFESLPPLLKHAAGDVVSEVGALDYDLVVLLSLGRLLPENAWDQVEQHRGAP